VLERRLACDDIDHELAEGALAVFPTGMVLGDKLVSEILDCAF
jgi:hypothetical protein